MIKATRVVALTRSQPAPPIRNPAPLQALCAFAWLPWVAEQHIAHRLALGQCPQKLERARLIASIFLAALIINLNGSETRDFSRGRRTVPPVGGPPFYLLFPDFLNFIFRRGIRHWIRAGFILT